MNTITINGNTITANGSIVISNGKVMVNGTDVTPESKEINIVVTGNCDVLDIDSCDKIEVKGSCNTIKTLSGSVDVGGDVSGGIQTMSGNVDCGHVGGSVSTMSGNIRNTK
jgi:hypothetical protein